MLLSIAGIVLIAYADGFVGPTAAGVMLSIGAAIGAALYKVSKTVMLEVSNCNNRMLKRLFSIRILIVFDYNTQH